MSSSPARLGSTRVLSRGKASVLVRSKLKLSALKGPIKGQSTEFNQDVIRIGADPGNDFVVTDDAVSSRHAEVALSEHGIVLRDVGSTNGTFIGTMRVKEIVVPAGTQFMVGETVIAIESVGEVRVPLSGAISFGRMLGASAAMREIFALLEKAAPSDKTVLIEGETGTGKDVCANAIHEASPRKDGPFVVFDCGAAAPTLIESELFGHAKGAYTGAHENREGAFERANGGTLFLDEIGELPLELQPKLLRALEEKAVRRLGDSKRIPVDVRVIAATNRNLRAEVAEKRFRQDLYFRLNVIRIPIPALRKRLEDLPLLCRAILDEEPGEEKVLTEPALAMLAAYDWPGNVRELRNVLTRAATFATGPIEPSHIPAFEGSELPGAGMDVEAHLPYHAAKERVLDRFERGYIEAVLQKANGNVSKAADQSGIPRQTLHRLMAKHGIKARR